MRFCEALFPREHEIIYYCGRLCPVSNNLWWKEINPVLLGVTAVFTGHTHVLFRYCTLKLRANNRRVEGIQNVPKKIAKLLMIAYSKLKNMITEQVIMRAEVDLGAGSWRGSKNLTPDYM